MYISNLFRFFYYYSEFISISEWLFREEIINDREKRKKVKELFNIYMINEKKRSNFRMDSSHSSLPNVDRANSTLFKRYLEEQHKSVIKTTTYPQLTHSINSTIQITHTHRQQQDIYTTNSDNNKSNHSVLIKRKYSNGRKPSRETSKQRSSHTSRFMKRFQRQHKHGETITNVQKRGLSKEKIYMNQFFPSFIFRWKTSF